MVSKEGIMVGNDCYVKKIDERSGKGEEKEVCWRRVPLAYHFVV